MSKIIRSRTSRLFGLSSSSSKTPTPTATRPPSRTLVLSSPLSQDCNNLEDSFGEFGYAVEELADSLSPLEPLFHDYYVNTADRPRSLHQYSYRPSFDRTEEMEEIEEEVDDDEDDDDMKGIEDMEEDVGGDDSDNSADFELDDFAPLGILATRITLFHVGKPKIIDIPYSPAASPSIQQFPSRASVSTRTSSSSHYNSGSHSDASTRNSSISEYASIVPSPKSHGGSVRIARRQLSGSSHKLGKVEELAVDIPPEYSPTYSRFSNDDSRSKVMYYVATKELPMTPPELSRRSSSLSWQRKRSISDLLARR